MRAQAFEFRDGRMVVFAWPAAPGSAPSGIAPIDDRRTAVAAIDLPDGRSVVCDLRSGRVEQRILSR